MFPFVYGFEWTPGYLIFVGVFLTVAVVVAATVGLALFRTVRDFWTGHAGATRWHAQFHDLSSADRSCRHAMTGELPKRVCEDGFDCRGCEMHQKLLSKIEPATSQEREVEILGMPVPLDRLYHRGHTWVRQEADGTVLVGLDEMGRRLLGEPESAELPAPGTRIETNVPAFLFRKNGSDVQVLAPVDGEVVETAPAGQDWLVRVRPAPAASFAHLLAGREVEAWYNRELERLQLAVAPLGSAPALADGGVLVEDLSAVCPPRQWDAACGAVFLDA
jgi:glycine cleavage system H protein